MSKKKEKKVPSFRKQMAQSMAELESIMNEGQSFDGNGRLTVRTIHIQEPGTYRAETIRALRQQLGVSQAIFAQMLGVSQVLIRSWERGARTPATIACRLLDIVRANPQSFSSLILIDRDAPTTANGGKLNAKRAVSPRRRRASAA